MDTKVAGLIKSVMGKGEKMSPVKTMKLKVKFQKAKKPKKAYKKGAFAQESMNDETPVNKKSTMKKRKGMKLTPVSKGHKPNGAHGRAAVKALGRTKTTGNFKAIESKFGKGAAIAAYQNKLRAHQAGTKKKSSPMMPMAQQKSKAMNMLSRGMKGYKK